MVRDTKLVHDVLSINCFSQEAHQTPPCSPHKERDNAKLGIGAVRGAAMQCRQANAQWRKTI